MVSDPGLKGYVAVARTELDSGNTELVACGLERTVTVNQHNPSKSGRLAERLMRNRQEGTAGSKWNTPEVRALVDKFRIRRIHLGYRFFFTSVGWLDTESNDYIDVP